VTAAEGSELPVFGDLFADIAMNKVWKWT